MSPAAENSRLRGEPDRMRRQQAAQVRLQPSGQSSLGWRIYYSSAMVWGIYLCMLLYHPNMALQLLTSQIVSSCSPQTKESLPVEEKLSLLNKLETAEARVQTLEAQVKT